MASKAVFGICNELQAEQVLNDLKAAGFSSTDISVLVPDTAGTHFFRCCRVADFEARSRPSSFSGYIQEELEPRSRLDRGHRNAFRRKRHGWNRGPSGQVFPFTEAHRARGRDRPGEPGRNANFHGGFDSDRNAEKHINADEWNAPGACLGDVLSLLVHRPRAKAFRCPRIPETANHDQLAIGCGTADGTASRTRAANRFVLGGTHK